MESTSPVDKTGEVLFILNEEGKTDNELPRSKHL